MTGGAVDLEPFREFLSLTRQKEGLKAQLKELNEKLTELARALPESMVNAGMPQLKLEIDGQNYTLYPRTTVRARAKEGDQDALNAVLSERGYSDLIQSRVNAQTLQALVNEFARSEEGIPSWLSEAVDSYEDTQLSARRA